ncbi:MAG: TIGR01440 family protein [Clostridia bacterium]|nr:TIGR01440 family protein [Clostridia bacterium]MBR7112772.1 TIGR01440 family protein [Clostridia bacterium]
MEFEEKTLYQEARSVIAEIAQKANLKQGSILVIGCSTSEIVGARIGTNSVPEVAAEVFGAFLDHAKENGIYLAVQCCEHLNRAVVTERAAAAGLEIVNAVPQPKAGGSMATAAYAALNDPVVVEEIKADAGIDIGFTLIGMHLKRVAVPVRLENNRIGEALVVAARTRPKFIGGARAVYDETML